MLNVIDGILCSSVRLTNIHKKVARKFALGLVLSLALKIFICVRLTQKYNYMLRSYSTGSSIVSCNTKDPIFMEIQLVARSALTSY